ncbi:hypothetical protein [Paenibacillus harenae]|nr:hypothetical protein [Paenibacillus harenae]MDQ0059989.1 hypothetical protein [Paenibacillus harenae]
MNIDDLSLIINRVIKDYFGSEYQATKERIDEMSNRILVKIRNESEI